MSVMRVMGPDQGRLSRRGLLAGLALAGAGALVACGGGGGGGTSGGTAPSGGGAATNSATVKMTDANKFDPDTVTIAKGGTVTWQNTSTVQHTVTCDPSKAANKADAQLPSGAQPFDSGLLNANATFQQTFNTSGTYKYFCIPHESLGMLGTIVVQ